MEQGSILPKCCQWRSEQVDSGFLVFGNNLEELGGHLEI